MSAMHVIATIVDTDGAAGRRSSPRWSPASGVTLVFSLAILGATASPRPAATAGALPRSLFGALAVLGLLATVAAIVVGVIVMTSK